VDLDEFMRDGYVAIRGALTAESVAACRELIWAAMERRGVGRNNPGSWPALVQGMDDLTGEPLLAAYVAPALTAAYDELIGPGRWERAVRSTDIGETVVVRFPAGRDDAPTRLLCGSHLAVPHFLAPHGEAGTNSDADFWRPSVLCLTAAHATGKAGDVFLCHPFMVHTATWPHRGTGPRMIAQPAVSAPDGFVLDGSDPSPVARAIVKGLAMAD
jgi:hypothetical protein